MSSATDLELLELIWNTSPLLAMLLGAFVVWRVLVKAGLIDGVKVSDDHVGRAIEDMEDRVAKLEEKDLHGRLSKIEGYLEGKK